MAKEPFHIQVEHGTAVVALVGELGIENAGVLYDQLRALRKRSDVDHVVLDFERLEEFESSGIAVVSLASAEFEKDGHTIEARHLSSSQQRALQMMPSRLTPARPEGADETFFERVGDSAFDAYDSLLHLAELLYDTIRMFGLTLIRKRKLRLDATVEQAVLIGVDAFLIIALLSFLLGLIMAFQSAYQLRQFGANIYVANLVGISMVREFGPMMTAIMLAGRSGSAIAAELGTMTVQEEVDALKTMGINPVRFLVLPRLAALTVVQPALTLMSGFIGMIGGFVIGVILLDLSSNVYFEQTVDALTGGDFSHALIKSVVFAWIIGITACYSGLQIKGGAASVGKATTRSVVASIFLIIVADSIFATAATLLSEDW
jgi:phospholipid/cholesterol/gamma-HCH transport system permease protein